MLLSLKRANDATLVAEDRQQCYEGTREGLLEDLRTWAESDNGEQFFWLHGPAGSGKTTIAQTFAAWVQEYDLDGIDVDYEVATARSSIFIYVSSHESPLRTLTRSMPELPRRGL